MTFYVNCTNGNTGPVSQGGGGGGGDENGATKFDCSWVSEYGVTCEKENERGNCSIIKPVFAFRQFL